MLDAVYVLGTLAFFAAMIWYVPGLSGPGARPGARGGTLMTAETWIAGLAGSLTAAI